VDYSRASKLIVEDAERTLERLRDIERKVEDPLLGAVRDKLTRASETPLTETDPENAKQAMDDIHKAKELLARARKAHLRPIRQMELDLIVSIFNENVRKFGRPSEETAFHNLVKTAQRSANNVGSSEFEDQLDQLRSKIIMILWRQDWFVIDRFKSHLESPYLFASADLHSELVKRGQLALSTGNVDEVRKVVMEMDLNRIGSPEANDFLAVTNIVRGS
jgi:molecular chaperone DnaK